MEHRIKKDESEFVDILRGKWRQDLLKFLERGDIRFLGPDRGIAIPVEVIKIPKLQFGPMISPAEVGESGNDEDSAKNQSEDLGIGEGRGKVGDDLGPVPADGDGKDGAERQAGQGRGHDIIEVEVPYSHFFELFREILELPLIKPKGQKSVKTTDVKYTDIHPVGPDALIHKRRTLRNALRRQIAEGTYDPERPRVFPIREDKRFKAPKEIIQQRNNAVLFFMMDVSASMDDEDRAVVRYFCALCEFWLSFNYDGLEIVWIIHDSEAEEVSKATFFRTQRGGGTTISTAHELMLKIIDERYPPANWNIYPFYFSDGFNFGDDDKKCLQLIGDRILLIANQYVHCEVAAARYWFALARGIAGVGDKFSPQGNFGQMLAANLGENDLVVCANLRRKADVPGAIKRVFRKGR